MIRAEIEHLADQWRDVYPAGQPYFARIVDLIQTHMGTGEIPKEVTVDLIFAVTRYVNKDSDILEWPNDGSVPPQLTEAEQDEWKRRRIAELEGHLPGDWDTPLRGA